MALLTAVSVTSAATTVAPLSPASTSETVSASDIGVNGALLQVINGGGASINVTLSDPGFSPIANPGTATPQPVAAGADRWFRLSPGHVNPTTQVATVGLSSIATVTYKLIRC